MQASEDDCPCIADWRTALNLARSQSFAGQVACRLNFDSMTQPSLCGALLVISNLSLKTFVSEAGEAANAVLQTEKQRIIWAYKILFLDVLFPLSLRKVIFMDSDQIIRADVAELWHMDLEVHFLFSRV